MTAVGLRRSSISRALARRLRWLDVTNDIPTEQRRRAMMATAGVFLLTVGPTLALVSLALPAGSSEDARAVASSLSPVTPSRPPCSPPSTGCPSGRSTSERSPASA